MEPDALAVFARRPLSAALHLAAAHDAERARLRLGAKVSAALFGALAVCSCYWLTFRYRIRYPFVWLFALLGASAPFLYRMNMTKAMSVSIILLVVGIHLLFQRRYVWLLPLAFVFTETYDMFVLLGLAVAIWAALRARADEGHEVRLQGRGRQRVVSV